MIGVPSSLYSGYGPNASVLKRHATSSLLKFDALIWSSGEYLVNFTSAPLVGHSPFAVEGWPCPANCCGTGVPTNVWAAAGVITQASPPAANTSADTDCRNFRDIVSLPDLRVFHARAQVHQDGFATIGQNLPRSNVPFEDPPFARQLHSTRSPDTQSPTRARPAPD